MTTPADEPPRLDDGPEDAWITLLLAHGAGAPMDSPFMERIADGVASNGFRVVRFEFPYMARRRREGTKSPPDRMPALLESFREAAANLSRPLVVGGKSMGGRVASHLADELDAAGLVCLGYPFHPPGRPEKTRTGHLAGLSAPTLVLQGDRDPFGRPDEVREYDLSDAISVAWIPDGDHSFKPRKSSGRTLDDNLDLAVDRIVSFLRSRAGKRGPRTGE
ncbi:MAG TPA: alpha/beta family hydrolase [Longimicrobiaceae bacterium]|nr:alpha/beta family hydrolase [Longimicrobiaceae bacterium]